MTFQVAAKRPLTSSLSDSSLAFNSSNVLKPEHPLCLRVDGLKKRISEGFLQPSKRSYEEKLVATFKSPYDLPSTEQEWSEIGFEEADFFPKKKNSLLERVDSLDKIADKKSIRNRKDPIDRLDFVVEYVELEIPPC